MRDTRLTSALLDSIARQLDGGRARPTPTSATGPRSTSRRTSTPRHHRAAPPRAELRRIAADIVEPEVPRFTVRLPRGAARKRGDPRWSKVDEARLALAGLCIDRLLGDGGRP